MAFKRCRAIKRATHARDAHGRTDARARAREIGIVMELSGRRFFTTRRNRVARRSLFSFSPRILRNVRAHPRKGRRVRARVLRIGIRIHRNYARAALLAVGESIFRNLPLSGAIRRFPSRRYQFSWTTSIRRKPIKSIKYRFSIETHRVRKFIRPFIPTARRIALRQIRNNGETRRLQKQDQTRTNKITLP